MLNIIIMDSDKWIAEGIRVYFSDKHIHCTLAHSPNVTFPHQIDSTVAISELHFAGKNIEDTLKSLFLLRIQSPQLKLIILTDISDDALINYVAKRLKGVEIVSKNAEVMTLAGAVFNQEKIMPEMTHSQPSESLTDREFRLLRLLASSKSMIEIGRELKLSNKTISHYKKTISKKLHCKNNKELFVRLRSYGF